MLICSTYSNIINNYTVNSVPTQIIFYYFLLVIDQSNRSRVQYADPTKVQFVMEINKISEK